MADAVRFHSRVARRETLHTLSLVTPHVRDGDVVLDVGCGDAYVTCELARRHRGEVRAVDIVDCRRHRTAHFALYNGIELPFPDASCDVVMLNFVLHHIPNELKPAVLDDVRRVTRRAVIVLEDTPRNAVDRYFNRRHGEAFRRRIGTTCAYGFYAQTEWTEVFAARGFGVTQVVPLPRLARDWKQPFARSCFVLEKPAAEAVAIASYA